jgi:hypothetical protein
VGDKVTVIVGSLLKVELAIEVEEKDIEGGEVVDAVVMVATFAGAETLCFSFYAHQCISAMVCI